MSDITIEEAAYDSDLYRQTLRLREEVLRKPLGMTLRPEELQKDPACRHIAALRDQKVVGCLVLMPLPEKILKMRQVAVAADMQRCGVGKKLILWAETFSRALGFRMITLHSRETAVGFYEKLGYKKTGQPFIEVGIPHIAMEKRL